MELVRGEARRGAIGVRADVRRILASLHGTNAATLMVFLGDLWWFCDAVALIRISKLSRGLRIAFEGSVAPLALRMIQERDPLISVYFPGVVPGHRLNEILFQGDEVGRDDWMRRVRRVGFIQTWRNHILGKGGRFRSCLSGGPR